MCQQCKCKIEKKWKRDEDMMEGMKCREEKIEKINKNEEKRQAADGGKRKKNRKKQRDMEGWRQNKQQKKRRYDGWKE